MSATTLPTILDAMTDPDLFGRAFSGSTWTAWRANLAAKFALPMSPDEEAIYHACTSRSVLPTAPAREAFDAVGRRGGKDRANALTLAYLAAFRDYTAILAPGERAVLMALAADRRQARVLRGYCEGLFDQSPLLRSMVARRTADAIHLTNGVAIEVHVSNYRSVRGYTLVAAVCNELAFWRAEDSANPDTEVLHALRPAMSTVPGAILIGTSSPYARRGVLWSAYRQHFGKDDDPVLVWQAPTRVMNPTVDQAVIDAAYDQDEAAAAAEYGAEFRRDVESFLDREALDAVVVPDRRELPPLGSVVYRAFVDPAGGSGQDAMTLAIAHAEARNGRRLVVLDLVHERRPPFSPEAVVAEFAEVLARYGVREVVGDRYAGEWPREQFRKAGVEYRVADRPKSDLYRDALPLITSGAVELLDHPRALTQLATLERRTARSGRDSIDHAPGAHDDLANVVAGGLVLAATLAGLVVRPQALEQSFLALEAASQWRPATESTLAPHLSRS